MTFSETLGIQHPIIQAPMAGVTTPEFVAAAAEAGVLGSIGAGYLSGEATREFIREVKKLTDKPFAVNLFVPEQTEMDQEQLRQAYLALQPVGRSSACLFGRRHYLSRYLTSKSMLSSKRKLPSVPLHSACQTKQ